MTGHPVTSSKEYCYLYLEPAHIARFDKKDPNRIYELFNRSHFSWNKANFQLSKRLEEDSNEISENEFRGLTGSFKKPKS